MRWLFFCVPVLLALPGCKSQDGTCLYATADPYHAGGSGSERLGAWVTLPDGTEHSTNALAEAFVSRDGGSRATTGPLEASISGRVTESTDSEVLIDACEPGAACEATLYRLSVKAPGLALAVPVGRIVSALWSFRIGSWATSEQIAILDGNGSDPSDGSRALWLWAADPSDCVEVAGLFKVESQRLFCSAEATDNQPCNNSHPPDDYAFRFSATAGGAQVTLRTGQSGLLLVTTSLGRQQHLTVHDLRSYQSTKKDDYWNWAWWAAGRPGPNGDPE